jgi:hypothetical protein
LLQKKKKNKIKKIFGIKIFCFMMFILLLDKIRIYEKMKKNFFFLGSGILAMPYAFD